MKQAKKQVQQTNKQKFLDHAAELWVNLIFAHLRHKKMRPKPRGGDKA